MQNTPPPPRPPIRGLALPRRLLDDAWWLAAALVDRPARVIRFPDRPAAHHTAARHTAAHLPEESAR